MNRFGYSGLPPKKLFPANWPMPRFTAKTNRPVIGSPFGIHPVHGNVFTPDHPFPQ